MQREIKFRAWDKIKKRMRIDILAVELSGMAHDCIYFREGDLRHREDVELMQYTGLKDKNGKEIYEGNIITCAAIGREVYDIIEKTDKPTVVEFRDGYFWPFGIAAQWRSSVDDIEIIGNIYENKDLLS